MSEPLTVFREFTLKIESGTVVAIVGPTGCGKTTLLNIIGLLETANEGSVHIGGKLRTPEDVGELSVGYLFQRDALLPWRTAMQNALLGLECRGQVPRNALEDAGAYFKRFGLAGFENSWPNTLSGGQRQRVALIQNLLVAPDIFLLDEPFGSLDYQTKLVLEQELLDVVRSAGTGTRKTVVLVTHDIEEAVTLGDRVVVLGPRATGILLDMEIEFDDKLRSPIAARQSPVMKGLFGRIWGALRSSLDESGTNQETRVMA